MPFSFLSSFIYCELWERAVRMLLCEKYDKWMSSPLKWPRVHLGRETNLRVGTHSISLISFHTQKSMLEQQLKAEASFQKQSMIFQMCL